MDFGLCCLFDSEPIRFRSYTLAGIEKCALRKGETEARAQVLSVWRSNCSAAEQAIHWCADHEILGFRLSSDLFPQVTRMIEKGFADQSDLEEMRTRLSQIDSRGVILSFHPGQHVNLGSPSTAVVENSLIDLQEHYAEASAVNAGEINIHIGGSYGDKPSALKRFREVFHSLPDPMKTLITLENDELNWSAEETADVCRELNVRMVYDIHHERCHRLKYPSLRTERELFDLARSTWPDRQIQRIHISSPRNGFTTITGSRPHSDFINPADIPEWLWDETVLADVEAKKKELAAAELLMIKRNRNR